MKSTYSTLLRRLFPNWPVPPPMLWLTGAGCLLCVLVLCFEKELWTDRGDTRRWLLTALFILLLAGVWQTLRMLWRWLAAYAGPRWMALLLRLGLLAVTVGAVLLGIALLILALLVILNPDLSW